MSDWRVGQLLQIAGNTSQFLKKQRGKRNGGPYTTLLDLNDRFIQSLRSSHKNHEPIESWQARLWSRVFRVFDTPEEDSSKVEEARRFYSLLRRYNEVFISIQKHSDLNLDSAHLFSSSGAKSPTLTRLDEETFSPDGTLVGMPILKGKVHVYDTESGDELFTVPTRGEMGTTVMAFEPGNRQLVVAGSTIQYDRYDLYNAGISMHVPGGRTLWDHKTDVGEVRATSLAFSPQGDRLAVGFEGGVIGTLEANSGNPIWNTNLVDNLRSAEDALISHCLFSPNGQILACALVRLDEGSNEVVILESESGKLRYRIDFSPYEINSLSFSQQGDQLAVIHGTSWDNASILDPRDGSEIASYNMTYEKCEGVKGSWMASSAFTRDGSKLLVGLGRDILISDPSSGHLIPHLRSPYPIRSFHHSADVNSLRAGVLGGSIETFKL